MLYEITLKSRLLFDVVYHVENAINTPDVTAVRFLNSRKEHLSTWDVSLLREQRDENDPLKGALPYAVCRRLLGAYTDLCGVPYDRLSTDVFDLALLRENVGAALILGVAPNEEAALLQWGCIKDTLPYKESVMGNRGIVSYKVLDSVVIFRHRPMNAPSKFYIACVDNGGYWRLNLSDRERGIAFYYAHVEPVASFKRSISTNEWQVVSGGFCRISETLAAARHLGLGGSETQEDSE